MNSLFVCPLCGGALTRREGSYLCPAGHCFAINTHHLGFAIHQNGFFARQPWVDLAGPAGRSMKILWHGNLVCSNRKAHACHSNLS